MLEYYKKKFLYLINKMALITGMSNHKQCMLRATRQQLLWLGTVKNYGKSWQKTWQTFVKITEKSPQRHGIKSRSEDHYRIYKTQRLALTTIITCSEKFSFICKILSLRSIKMHIPTIMSHSHIQPVSNKAQGGLW